MIFNSWFIVLIQDYWFFNSYILIFSFWCLILNIALWRVINRAWTIFKMKYLLLSWHDIATHHQSGATRRQHPKSVAFALSDLRLYDIVFQSQFSCAYWKVMKIWWWFLLEFLKLFLYGAIKFRLCSILLYHNMTSLRTLDRALQKSSIHWRVFRCF